MWSTICELISLRANNPSEESRAEGDGMKEYIAEYIVPVEKKGNDNMFDFVNSKRLICCKDCKSWRKSYFESVDGMVCNKTRYIMKPDDYCSMAKPKENKDE